eukprot:CAMPEP_0182538422 /NCGR_PEP_ID=MMETSP1323-20130603/23659_1 /TAXON_ID=236787 /ORGANISM="Florenciella parvula, Strain RCC1693" /LENGTH=49 /DNA_ID= /DNA_START= /DNA_END= /DNA_ORIENTATION=
MSASRSTLLTSFSTSRMRGLDNATSRLGAFQAGVWPFRAPTAHSTPSAK